MGQPYPRHPGREVWTAGAVIFCLAMLLGACAPARTAPISTDPPAGGAAISRGTILAMRPVAGTAAGQAMDFIVQEADGGTIAVVQANELRFQVGEQVLVIRGDRTRLSRPGA